VIVVSRIHRCDLGEDAAVGVGDVVGPPGVGVLLQQPAARLALVAAAGRRARPAPP
jgi:hypothetical protein